MKFFNTLLLYLVFKFQCVFCIYSTSRFALTTFQVLSGTCGLWLLYWTTQLCGHFLKYGVQTTCIFWLKVETAGNSLVVQWLGLHTSTARAMGLIPGWGTKIPHALQRGPKKKKKKGSTDSWTPSPEIPIQQVGIVSIAPR